MTEECITPLRRRMIEEPISTARSWISTKRSGSILPTSMPSTTAPLFMTVMATSTARWRVSTR